MKNRKGFTLIEILIVVAIIGILSSVVLVGLGPVQRRGRDSRRIADLKETQTALELYYNKCGFYPGQAAGGGTGGGTDIPPVGGGGTGGVGCGNFSVVNTWAAMRTSLLNSNLGTKQIPNDPASSQTYYYSSTSDGSGYVVGAKLEDTSNPSLNNDTDGTINGISCDDPIYCVEF